jgi:hypothetical protein
MEFKVSEEANGNDTITSSSNHESAVSDLTQSASVSDLVQRTSESRLKPRTTKLLLNDIRKEYCILLNLIIETGFTGIESNYRIRESLNKLIFEIRRIQDLVIKIKGKVTENKVSNKIKNKLKTKDADA